MAVLASLSSRNDGSHIDLHGHDCPSAPAMQHSGAVAAALRR